MAYTILSLKPKKKDSIHYRHPWVFSGALEVHKDVKNGDIVWVADELGEVIATGMYSTQSFISVRVLAFEKIEITKEWIKEKIENAGGRRLFPNKSSNGYRLIFGEADGLPGLVVDRYDDVFVLQISCMGMENLKSFVVEALNKLYKPSAIVERSDLASRTAEGMEELKTVLSGEVSEPIKFKENNHTFLSDVIEGQKTGFFLDQKDLRNEIELLAKGNKVLNLFSYTGAAGIYAMAGDAESVHHVDSSSNALEMCHAQTKLNKFDADKCTTEEADIFVWLANQKGGDYDMVIMDPPAIIKSIKDKEAGMKAYHFLNRAAMRFVKDGGIFITSSCSHYFTEEELLYTLRRASVQNNLWLEPIKIIRQSHDHPVSLYFPESSYLKSVIFRVRK